MSAGREFETDGLTIRAACAADGQALTRLIEDAMGEGCFDMAHVNPRYGRVCEVEGKIVGTALMDDASPRKNYDFLTNKMGVQGLEVLMEHPRIGHVRYVAVDPAYRRRGIGGELMRVAETALHTDGIDAFYVIAWVRADSGECEGGKLYERAGYTCLVQVPDFYREWSFETSTVCPACGEPPCTCEARVYVKLPAAPPLSP